MTEVASRYHRVGLIGHGIGPSLSPALHVEEARRLGLDYEYVTIDLIDRPDLDLGKVLDQVEADGFAAVNVTHPFKQQAVNLVNRRSLAVERIGSTNLVVFTLGVRTAHNTDHSGFRAGLEAFLGGRDRGTVLQVGAGGAGLATAYALLTMGFDLVHVADRRPTAATSLVERLESLGRGRITTVPDARDVIGCVDGLVHVTPTGMAEHPGVAVDVDLLPARAWVADVVYRPLVTDLVARARRRGLATLDGGAMAVGQAVESLRLITGREPDAERMAAHFRELAAAE